MSKDCGVAIVKVVVIIKAITVDVRVGVANRTFGKFRRCSVRITNKTTTDVKRRRKVHKLSLIFGVNIKELLISLIMRQEQIVNNSRGIPHMRRRILIKAVSVVILLIIRVYPPPLTTRVVYLFIPPHLGDLHL